MIGLDNPLHIALVLVVVLLVFGAKRLPELGGSMGAGLRSFKHSLQGSTVDDDDSITELMTRTSEESAPTTRPPTPAGARRGEPPAI